MRSRLKAKSLSLIFSALLAGVSAAQVQPRPEPPRLYNNLSREFPDFLNREEAARLEEKLEQFSNETSNQICVVIVDDLAGMDAGSYAFVIGNNWGVGKNKFNNGVVVLIKPTGNAGGRDIFIATGYGLEPVIPDLMTKRIRDEMVPMLKAGRNFEAIDLATDTLMKLAKGEISVKDFSRKKDGLPLPAVVIIVILLVIFFIFRGGGGSRTYSRGGRTVFWGPGFFGGGGFGGGSSGGGGWGGFGGGGFGGGGSGGKW
jgi:uncharacterized protein